MSKFTAFSIAPAVSQLFNLSIRLSKLPDVWKLSLVVPVPKSAKKNLPSNYRPIYLMSILSKVLKGHIFSLVASLLEDHFLLSDCQWGLDLVV